MTDIDFIHPDTGFISTGIDWEGGEILFTQDAGETWLVAAESEFRLSGMDTDLDGNLYSIGFVGRYIKQDVTGWTTIQLPVFESYTDIATWDGSVVLIVKGDTFANGSIVKLDQWGNFISRDTFLNDLETITFIDDTHAMATGYGIVLRSDDAGDSWYPLDIVGDYFKDVQFPTSQIGYMCGYSGSILKSTDGGYHWSFLRDGDKILVADKRFNALHFEDEYHGYLVGMNGLCWRTEDGGKHWQIIKKLPKYDYTEVHVMADQAYLISKEGRLVIVDHR